VIPPDAIAPGVPAHPIYIPVYPAHPIVIPPGAIAPGVPEHPIVLPPPVSPEHPIVIPPDAISPGVPAHPIVIPPVPPLGIWGDVNAPTHPIVLPPGERPKLVEWTIGWSEQTGWVVVGVPNVPTPTPSKRGG
jgi:hypothetical protein